MAKLLNCDRSVVASFDFTETAPLNAHKHPVKLRFTVLKLGRFKSEEPHGLQDRKLKGFALLIKQSSKTPRILQLLFEFEPLCLHPLNLSRVLGDVRFKHILKSKSKFRR
ncbi:hypothetical protein D4Q71_22970 [Rhodopseudomonas palustris]|nr:hypothetical protein B1S06_18435 [Rhodopseudomonas palustris]PPQ40942.1 hypothetical protein CKO39_24595 [Rhodopseudomonas palustris]RJF60399.1 hypothetical protein D4Q71_22970 [Rhodopseudomonas palustris]